MTRETAKNNLDIIKAFAEGKDIQMLEIDGKTWSDIKEPYFTEIRDYRIKPESKYVPWTKENCPLKCGDVVRYKNSVDKRTTIIDAIDLSDENDNVIHFAFDYTDCEYGINNWASLDYLFNCYVMADGTPCGMKVEA